MDAIKKDDRRAKWRALIVEQEKSGLSQTEFCKQRHLNFPQFYYYVRVIKSKHPASVTPLDLSHQPLFSEVKIKKSESNTASEIKIILPNGFACFIPSMLDVSQVKRLMEALLSCSFQNL